MATRPPWSRHTGSIELSGLLSQCKIFRYRRLNFPLVDRCNGMASAENALFACRGSCRLEFIEHDQTTVIQSLATMLHRQIVVSLSCLCNCRRLSIKPPREAEKTRARAPLKCFSADLNVHGSRILQLQVFTLELACNRRYAVDIAHPPSAISSKLCLCAVWLLRADVPRPQSAASSSA